MRERAVPGAARTAGAVRGLWPDRNPLRRACDRAEAAILAGLLALFLIGAPVAALAAGRVVDGAAVRTAHAEQAAWHQVPAVLLTGAPSSLAYPADNAPARVWWTAPDGARRTGEILVPGSTRAGTTVMVWVDATGRLATGPLPHSQVAGQTILASVLAAVALGLLLAGAGLLAHRALDRRRLAAWDAGWRATGPRWTSRR
jgi:hypothetical protein